MGRPLSTASPVALRFSTSDVSAFLSPNFSMLFMALRSLAGLLLKQYNRRLEQKEHKTNLSNDHWRYIISIMETMMLRKWH